MKFYSPLIRTSKIVNNVAMMVNSMHINENAKYLVRRVNPRIHFLQQQ
jgi:hypothetical protein